MKFTRIRVWHKAASLKRCFSTTQHNNNQPVISSLHPKRRYFIDFDEHTQYLTENIQPQESFARNERHFINLTNGIEALPVLPLHPSQINFLRLQSTHLEKKDFERLLRELDNNLLMNLALGNTCYVYDYGSRKKNPADHLYGHSRLLWMGIPFIRMVLNRIWYARLTDPREFHMYVQGKIIPNQGKPDQLDKVFRAELMLDFFKTQLMQIDKSTVSKLDYFKRYLNEKDAEYGVQLIGVGKYSEKDADLEYYKKTIVEWHKSCSNL
jgi:hypothetical protein